MKTFIFFLALLLSICVGIMFIVDTVDYVIHDRQSNVSVTVIIIGIVVISSLWTIFYHL